MGERSNQYNRGPREVIRVHHDLRGSLPINVDESFQPVTESRALRMWELFHEGIIDWSCVGAEGATAGQFSGVQVSLITGAVPRGTCLILEEVLASAAPDFNVVMGLGGQATVVAVQHRDTRFAGGPLVGGSMATVLLATRGALVVIPGLAVDVIKGNVRTVLGGGVLVEFPSMGIPAIGLYCTVVNTGFTFALKGKVVFPRS